MDGIVSPVAAIHFMADGHSSIRGYVYPENQLFQVGPVVLVDAVSNLRPAFRCLVLPLKSYCGGVVVNPLSIQLKILDDVQGYTEKKATSPWCNQSIQASSYTVIVDGSFLRLG